MHELFAAKNKEGCLLPELKTAFFVYNRSKTFPVSLDKIAACC